MRRRCKRALNERTFSAARRCRARVAPVGEAWREAFRRQAELVLHAPDGSHPSPAGSYLAACVFYATIYGTSPAGLPARVTGTDEKGRRRVLVSLAKDRAGFLQRVAWQTVEACELLWRPPATGKRTLR